MFEAIMEHPTLSAAVFGFCSQHQLFSLDLLGGVKPPGPGEREPTWRATNSGSRLKLSDLRFGAGAVYNRAGTRLAKGRGPLSRRKNEPESVTQIDEAACFSTGNPQTAHSLLAKVGSRLMTARWVPNEHIARQIYLALFSPDDRRAIAPRHAGSVYGAVYDGAVRSTALSVPDLSQNVSVVVDRYLMRDAFMAPTVVFTSRTVEPRLIDSASTAAEMQRRRPQAGAIADISDTTKKLARAPDGHMAVWPEQVQVGTHPVMSEDVIGQAMHVLHSVSTALDYLELHLPLIYAQAARVIKLHATGLGDRPQAVGRTGLLEAVPTAAVTSPSGSVMAFGRSPFMEVSTAAGRFDDRSGSRAYGREVALKATPKVVRMPRPSLLMMRGHSAALWLAWYRALQHCGAAWAVGAAPIDQAVAGAGQPAWMSVSQLAALSWAAGNGSALGPFLCYQYNAPLELTMRAAWENWARSSPKPDIAAATRVLRRWATTDGTGDADVGGAGHPAPIPGLSHQGSVGWGTQLPKPGQRGNHSGRVVQMDKEDPQPYDVLMSESWLGIDSRFANTLPCQEAGTFN